MPARAKRRERRGDVVLDRLLALLLGLELLPVHEHLVGVADIDVTEDVRVTVDQLAHQAFRDVVDVPPALVRRDLRVERHLEQHIAELLADRVGVVGVDRLEQLVGLLQEVPGERRVRLLGVPRTSARRPQPRLHADQIEQSLPALARRDRPFGDVGERTVHAEGLGDGVVSMPVAVLEMRATWSSWTS